jgi:hypothetical protein
MLPISGQEVAKFGYYESRKRERLLIQLVAYKYVM